MSCSPQIRPENSARRFTRPARLVRRLVDGDMIRRRADVLEVGAGSLRNAAYLLGHGHRVVAEEILPTVRKFLDDYKLFLRNGGRVCVEQFPQERFDLVVSTFAIETICPQTLRLSVMETMVQSLKPGALLALALRGVPDVKTAKAKGKPYRDGYLTPGKTFIKPYTVPEVGELLVRLGLEDVQFFCRVREPQVIDVIARKPAPSTSH